MSVERAPSRSTSASYGHASKAADCRRRHDGARGGRWPRSPVDLLEATSRDRAVFLGDRPGRRVGRRGARGDRRRLAGRLCRDGLGPRPVHGAPAAAPPTRVPRSRSRDRLAGHAIEDIGEPLLRHFGHGVDRAAVDRDRHEIGCRVEVVVPHAMVHRLKVPLALTGSRIDTDTSDSANRLAPGRRPPQ